MRISALGNTATDFASDDFLAIDGTTNGSRKMAKDTLLELTSKNAVEGTIAPDFDDTRDASNPYKAGESVYYNGSVYTFKVDHYGAWSSSDVYKDGDILNSLNKDSRAIYSILGDINDKGEFSVISSSFTTLFNGYIGANNGNVYAFGSNVYQIKYKQFSKDTFVRIERSVSSPSNANIIAIVDNINKIFVGANIYKNIVDDGKTEPLDKIFFVPAGCYLVWGLHSNAESQDKVSSCDATKLKTIVTAQGTELLKLDSDISYFEPKTSVSVNTLTLSNAYIDSSGKVKSWGNPNYCIYSYQAATEEYVKIRRTESVYVNNDVICKCATISGIAIGNYIDGEVLCTGSDYPFETIVHLNAGEYIVRSGTTSADNSVFTKMEKKYVKAKIFPLEGMNVDFEGDSIMTGTGGGGGWPSLIASIEKVNATNNGASGYKIQGILNKIKSRTPSDYDMIVVQGGFNDGTTPLGTFDRDDYRDEGGGDYDQTTFYGAMEILCRYCLGNFERALFIVGYNWGNNTWNTTLANACVEVCEKWGMPYVDLRSKAGFNLHTESLRVKYGVYIGDLPDYDATAGYSLDDQVKKDGKAYKANMNISAPAGTFDPSKWTYIGMVYDQCHCNADGYKKSVGPIISAMKAIAQQ